MAININNLFIKKSQILTKSIHLYFAQESRYYYVKQTLTNTLRTFVNKSNNNFEGSSK